MQAKRSKTRARDTSKRQTIDLLREVGYAINALFGKRCEVVIHDLTDPKHSFTWIAGDVTGRKIGDGMMDLHREMWRAGRTDPIFNYTTYTREGKTYKSAILWLRTPEGEIHGAFCIIMDITGIGMVMDFIQTLAPNPLHVSQFHPRDLRDEITDFMADYEMWVGISPQDMTKEERLELVRYLDERGVFHVRNAVGIVAERLGVTRKTVYNYLNEIVENRPTPQD